MDRARITLIVEAALCIALAVVLAQIRIWRMPMGGTISLEMLPLIVFALRRGAVPGVLAGALYGVVNYMFDPVGVVHWAQYMLDYPVAHGLVGVAGLFSGAWHRAASAGRARALAPPLVAGTVAAGAARFAAHWVSGVVFFAEYAPKGQPVWLYSLLYNGTYLLPSAIACGVAAAALMPILEKRVPSS